MEITTSNLLAYYGTHQSGWIFLLMDGRNIVNAVHTHDFKTFTPTKRDFPYFANWERNYDYLDQYPELRGAVVNAITTT